MSSSSMLTAYCLRLVLVDNIVGDGDESWLVLVVEVEDGKSNEYDNPPTPTTSTTATNNDDYDEPPR